MNPAAYDPRYHFELAVEAGCNAYAAPLGSFQRKKPDALQFLKTVMDIYSGATES